MKDIREVTLSYTFLCVPASFSLSPARLSSVDSSADSPTLQCSRARRDSFGNLVPAEGPLAVAGSAPVV